MYNYPGLWESISNDTGLQLQPARQRRRKTTTKAEEGEIWVDPDAPINEKATDSTETNMASIDEVITDLNPAERKNEHRQVFKR